MDIQQICSVMGFKDEFTQQLKPFENELLEHSSNAFPWFMEKDFYSQYYPLCKGPDECKIFPSMDEVSEIVRNTPEANRYSWMLHYAMFLAPQNISALPWREPEEFFGDKSGIFMLLIALSTLPLVRRKHEELNLPETFMHSIAEWIGGTINIYAAAHNGNAGHSIAQTFWLRHSIEGNLFRIGSLEFLPGCWKDDLPVVFKNKKNRSITVLCRDNWAFDKNGFRVDPEKTKAEFTAHLTFEQNHVAGTPISPYGFPATDRITELDLDEWETICSPTEKILTVHIPAKSRITTSELYHSMRDAIIFFRKNFNVEYKIFTCISWLFNPAWEKEMPDSNIAKWQRQVYLTPAMPPHGQPGFFFVYGLAEGDPRQQKITTSLHRAFCNQFEKNIPLRCGCMFILAEDIENFGTEYYRKQWSLQKYSVPENSTIK